MGVGIEVQAVAEAEAVFATDSAVSVRRIVFAGMGFVAAAAVEQVLAAARSILAESA